MTRITAPPPPTFRAGRTSRRGDPVWEIAHLFPIQGHWTESQYLALDARRLVEFDNGMIEVLPLPTKSHQLMVLFLFEALRRFLTGRGVGRRVLVAPYRLRISDTKHREPDVL